MTDAAPGTSLGFLAQTTGETALDGQAYRLMRAWEDLLVETFGKGAPFMLAPALIEQEVLQRTGYLAHFPQHVLKVMPVAKGSSTADRYLTPASCLHVYPQFEGDNLAAPQHYTVLGRCGRHESGSYDWPYRLSTFHMLEFVTISRPDELVTHRDLARRQAEELFASLGITGVFQEATDPFFAGEADGAYLLQKIKGLKQEFVVANGENGLALASVNLHEGHFTDAFAIQLDNRPAGSFCLAFGMERLCAHSLSLWGNRQDRWPGPLQNHV
jgi:hypothetical protein